MSVVNIMEKIIEEKLDQQLENYDCCKCKDCRQDMLAFALNTIHPKYVNSTKGELFGRIDSSKMQKTVDIDIAIARAINVVSSSPKHRQ